MKATTTILATLSHAKSLYIRSLCRPMSTSSACMSHTVDPAELPISAPSPFERPKRKCVLCKYKVELDYKNTRLLSQFMSPFTGQIYDKHITGLCEKQQTLLEKEIKKAQRALMMPRMHRDIRFNKDPPLFNADRPQRANPY